MDRMDPRLDIPTVLARLDRIQTLTDELTKARGDLAEQQDIADRIRREIEAVKTTLQAWTIRSA
jgi:predicted transcriptional regulator